MANFSVATIFTAKDRITKAFGRMSSGADKFGSSADRAFRKANKSASTFSNIVGGILTAGAIQSVTNRMREFRAEIVETSKKAQQLDLMFKTVFGQASAKEMAFVRAEAEKLGLQFDIVAKEYAKVAAATRQTKLEGKATKEIFTAVVEASTAMQLSADDTAGALRALTQIISKGKVQAEELRGQLGERIPGAFKMAAKAMKVTEAELNKLMETGQVTAEEFIPAFAKVLREDFSKAAVKAAKSFQGTQNAFKNAMFDFKNAAGQIILPVLTRLLEAFTKLLKPATEWIKQNEFLVKIKIEEYFNKFGSALKFTWEMAQALTPALKVLSMGVLAFQATLFAAAIAQGVLTAVGWAYAAFVKARIFLILAKSIGFASTAMTIFNAIMMANPIGLIIAGVVALGAVIAGVIIYWDEIVAGFMRAIELAKEFLGFGDDTEKKITVKTEELNQAPNKKEAEARARMSVDVGGKFTFENAPQGMNFVQTNKGQMQTSGLGAQ